MQQWPLIALASCLAHFGVFALASRGLGFKQASRIGSSAVIADKARSWVVTGFTALVVSFASLPFLADLFRTGDVAQVARRPALSFAVTVFFICYLFWCA
jgi:hypothetical protein